MTSPAQAAARQRFMAAWAPMTDIPQIQQTFIDPGLVGRQLYHRRLGIVLAYECSFDNAGEIIHGGTVVRANPGLGIAVGGPWAYWANRLSIIVPGGDNHVSHSSTEGRQP
jgi:hypothetical protein